MAVAPGLQGNAPPKSAHSVSSKKRNNQMVTADTRIQLEKDCEESFERYIRAARAVHRLMYAAKPAASLQQISEICSHRQVVLEFHEKYREVRRHLIEAIRESCPDSMNLAKKSSTAVGE
jgi:hypothetical protein